MSAYTQKKILVVVKTYPNPSKKYQETVCVAGVLLESPSSWIRIYPISFRDLPFEQQFKKFQVIEVEIQRNKQDIRPESYNIKADSIKLLETIGTDRNWEERKKYFYPFAPLLFSDCWLVVEKKFLLSLLVIGTIVDFIWNSSLDHLGREFKWYLGER